MRGKVTADAYSGGGADWEVTRPRVTTARES